MVVDTLAEKLVQELVIVALAGVFAIALFQLFAEDLVGFVAAGESR